MNRERPAGNCIQVKPVLPTCLEEMRSDHGDHRRVLERGATAPTVAVTAVSAGIAHCQTTVRVGRFQRGGTESFGHFEAVRR